MESDHVAKVLESLPAPCLLLPWRSMRVLPPPHSLDRGAATLVASWTVVLSARVERATSSLGSSRSHPARREDGVSDEDRTRLRPAHNRSPSPDGFAHHGLRGGSCIRTIRSRSGGAAVEHYPQVHSLGFAPSPARLQRAASTRLAWSACTMPVTLRPCPGENRASPLGEHGAWRRVGELNPPCTG